MRNFIFALAAMFCFLGTGVKAMTLQTLYTSCLAWADIGFAHKFNVAELGAEKTVKVVGCMTYLSAWRDASGMNCYVREHHHPEMGQAAFGFSNNINPEQLAQMTINFAKVNPELWDANPSYMYDAIAPSGKCE